jgi:hypothetical protein
MFPTMRLAKVIAAVCPIQGVAVVDPNDRATWRIDFDPSATDAQRQAAQAVLSAFDPSAPVVPGAVTPLQARRALRAAGLYDTVKAAVDAATDPDVGDSWEFADAWHRDATWIATLAGQLGLTSQQVDALFIQAAGL